MNNDTVTSTLTSDDAKKVDLEYRQQSEDTQALERLIGTYESYGTFNIVRPKLSKDVS